MIGYACPVKQIDLSSLDIRYNKIKLPFFCHKRKTERNI